jgi:hypothetical protein
MNFDVVFSGDQIMRRDGCSGTGDCVLDMSESHSVGAEFTVAP